MATVNYLLVGGGAGGGGAIGGGGGGGRVVTGSSAITSGSFPIIVGAGGNGGASGAGSDGGDTTFNGITAKGGGGGGFYISGGGGGNNGRAGGSGGGAGATDSGAATGGSASGSGSGNAGGNGRVSASSFPYAAGGGGGANAAGGSAVGSTAGGAGGAGLADSTSGSSVTYGGGGGGAAFGAGNTGAGAGGSGGGGAGSASGAGTAGTAGLGGGGGGGEFSSNGGAGGSGVAILSYTTGALSAIGGTISFSGGNTIHTFTVNDTFQVVRAQALSTTQSQVATLTALKTYAKALSATQSQVATLSILVAHAKTLSTTQSQAATLTKTKLNLQVWPPSDRTVGGAAVTLKGSGLVNGATIAVDGTPCTSVVWVSSTRMTCVVPAHAVAVTTIVITNPDTSTFAATFTYYTPASNNSTLLPVLAGSAIGILEGSLSVSDTVAQKTCSFIMKSAFASAPTNYASLRIGVGSLADNDLVFQGEVQSFTTRYDESTGNKVWDVVGVGQTYRLKKRLVSGTYTGSITDIAATLLANYSQGVTGVNIQPGLPTATVVYPGTGDLQAALQQLVSSVSPALSFYIDDSADLHLFATESLYAPEALNSSNTTLTPGSLKFNLDTSQVRNRIKVVGATIAQTTITAPNFGNQVPVASVANIGNSTIAGYIMKTPYQDGGITWTPLISAWSGVINSNGNIGDNFVSVTITGSPYSTAFVQINGNIYYYGLSGGGMSLVPNLITPVKIGDAVIPVPNIVINGLTHSLVPGDSLTVYLRAQVDDTVSQAAIAAAEGNGSDGIREFPLNDQTLITYAACQAAGGSALRPNAYNTGDYVTMDKRSRMGASIHINMPGMPVVDLRIQTVNISQLGIGLNVPPLYSVKASDVYPYQLTDFIRNTVLG